MITREWLEKHKRPCGTLIGGDDIQIALDALEAALDWYATLRRDDTGGCAEGYALRVVHDILDAKHPHVDPDRNKEWSAR